MISATRVHVAERGADPRRLKLMAFGGAGPIHACAIARALKMPGFVCPAKAGVASALGFLTAPASFEFARTFMAKLSQEMLTEVEDAFAGLTAEGRDTLRDAGVPEGDMTFIRQANLRHVGQGHDIVVTLPSENLAEVDLERDLKPRFYEAYETIYGHAHRHLDLEITTCRLTASGPVPNVKLQETEAGSADASSAKKGNRPAYFAEAGGFVETDLYDRDKLQAGMRFAGPAIVEERDSTAVIGTDTEVIVDAWGNLIVSFTA
jgi:N-methylhydantoinase A